MTSKISFSHKSEIETDIKKAIAYYAGIYMLDILIHKLSNEFKYSLSGYESCTEAVKTIRWTYAPGSFDQVCLYLVEPSINQKNDYLVQRWLVRVSLNGHIKDELLVVVEDFARAPIAKLMI